MALRLPFVATAEGGWQAPTIVPCLQAPALSIHVGSEFRSSTAPLRHQPSEKNHGASRPRQSRSVSVRGAVAQKAEGQSAAGSSASESQSQSQSYGEGKQLCRRLHLGVEALERRLAGRAEALTLATSEIEELLKRGAESEECVLRDAEGRAASLRGQVEASRNRYGELELQFVDLQKETSHLLLRLTASEEEGMGTAAKWLERKKEWEKEKEGSKQGLADAVGREAELATRVAELEVELSQRQAFLLEVHQESTLSSQALQQAAQALTEVRGRNLELERDLNLAAKALEGERGEGVERRQEAMKAAKALEDSVQTVGKLEGRVGQLDAELASTRQLAEKSREETEAVRKRFQVADEALREAQANIGQLESNAGEGREKLRGQMAELQKRVGVERELKAAEAKVKELSIQVESLKGSMETSQTVLAAVQKETLQNADLLTQATDSKQKLEAAEMRIESLAAQVGGLEEDVGQKEALLAEVGAENVKTTKALHTARQYKQDLNVALERAAELEETADSKEAIVSNLQAQLAGNMRAQRAELALQAAEQRMKDLQAENNILSRGVALRDESVEMMRAELQASAEMLQGAADNREALKALQRQVQELLARAGPQDPVANHVQTLAGNK